MLYAILALYLLQAILTVYLMFVVRHIDNRLKDLEDHLFDT